MQPKVLSVLADLLIQQEHPSAGPCLPIDHVPVLKRLLQHLPDSAPLASAAKSLSKVVCSPHHDTAALEDGLLAMVMDEHATPGVAAAGIANFISQGHLEVAAKGIVQALSRFGTADTRVIHCLANFQVRPMLQICSMGMLALDSGTQCSARVC